MSEWLETLKEGDQVVVSSSGYEKLERLTHTTKTQLHIGTTKYRRSDGRRMGGDSWTILRLEEPTEACIARITRKRRIAFLQEFKWDRLDDEKLQILVNQLGAA